jgi:hypothetical protein
MINNTKLMGHHGMKAESLIALAQGNALCRQRVSVFRPEGARATTRAWLLPLQGGRNRTLVEKKFKLPAGLEVCQKKFQASSRAGSI